VCDEIAAISFSCGAGAPSYPCALNFMRFFFMQLAEQNHALGNAAQMQKQKVFHIEPGVFVNAALKIS
jgi:hypothetical protein